MRILITAVVMVVTITGCARVHSVNPADGGTSLKELNRTLRSRRVEVELVDGTRFAAENVEVTTDSCSMVVRLAAWRDTVLPSAAIRSITRSSAERGALEGLLFGLALSGIATTLVPREHPYDTADVVISFFAWPTVYLAPPAGLIYGMTSSPRDVYEFAARMEELRESQGGGSE